MRSGWSCLREAWRDYPTVLLFGAKLVMPVASTADSVSGSVGRCSWL